MAYVGYEEDFTLMAGLTDLRREKWLLTRELPRWGEVSPEEFQASREAILPARQELEASIAEAKAARERAWEYGSPTPISDPLTGEDDTFIPDNGEGGEIGGTGVMGGMLALIIGAVALAILK